MNDRKINASKLTSLVIAVLVLAAVLASCAFVGCKQEECEYRFHYWNDCSSLTALKQYVASVTDNNADTFIPVEDRIAVFDMDGTLYGELFPTYLEYLLLEYRGLDDPTYEAPEEVKRVAQLIRDSKHDWSYPSDMAMQHALAQAKAFEGMSVKDFEAYVADFLKKTPEGFAGMTYGSAFYQPMLEVIDYLQQNGFKTYIVSGSDRFICRALASEPCHIPNEQIIGMDVKLRATDQGDADSLDYQFARGDEVLRTDTLLVKNLKTNKVLQIVQEIDKQPVLSFGNSSGDVSMHRYTVTRNRYKAAAFMLIANDEARDYGNTVKAEQLGEQWKAEGFHVISMRDDWTTIYGANVSKTNS
jgi:phosphoglycolate phosphatase-like HAD superfamily hydrolase